MYQLQLLYIIRTGTCSLTTCIFIHVCMCTYRYLDVYLWLVIVDNYDGNVDGSNKI